MIPLKVNGAKINFPSSVYDLTLKQFFDLRKSHTLLEEVTSLAGMDKDVFSNFKTTKEMHFMTGIMAKLANELKQGFDNYTLPGLVEIGNRQIKVPAKLRLEPVGAFMSVHDILSEQINKCQEANLKMNITDRIPEILAHYFYVHVNPDLPYSDEAVDAADYMSLIYGIKFTEAVPIANFFFRKFPNLL